MPGDLVLLAEKTMMMQLRQAERKQAKIRIGMFGPSGSGKTMSALKLARGITEWNKIAVIDTENNSADLYSHLGDYNVLTVESPFNPEKYIEAIRACEHSGMEVIIIDSITHEWAGAGGILELVDELGKAVKNPMQVWAKLTPRHNRFISAILESPAHVICCGRSKQDYVMNQVEKNGRTINVPEKVGLKAVTREGFDYEMTLSFDLAINHYANTSKDRTDLFMGRPDFIISEETGKTIIEWNKTGKINVAEQKKEIMRQLKRIGVNVTGATAEQIAADVLDIAKLDLKEENFEAIIDALRSTASIPDFLRPDDTKEKEKKEISAEINKGNGTPKQAKLSAPADQSTASEPRPDLIKPFQIKRIKELARKKFNDDSPDGIRAFLIMSGVNYEKLEDLSAQMATTAIKIIENYQTDGDSGDSGTGAGGEEGKG